MVIWGILQDPIGKFLFTPYIYVPYIHVVYNFNNDLPMTRSLFEHIETNFALYKHFRTCTNFLEMCDKWACIHELGIIQ